MMSSSSIRSPGPLGWRNWKADLAGATSTGAFEYTLYTDTSLSGEVSVGPYTWINSHASSTHAAPGDAKPAVVLRADIHLTDSEFVPSNIDWDKTDTKDYLAGDLGDELAGLTSLALARRMRSGGLTRRFDLGDDKGSPILSWHRIPRLSPPPPGRRSLLPLIEADVNIDTGVELLGSYPTLGLNDARALARAARLYGQALWVSDDDPTQAWLRFVSALEVAANQWKAPEKLTNAERIQLADPELAGLIDATPDEVRDDLRAKLAPTVRSTAKFLDFTHNFLPDAPDWRPAFGTVDWDNLLPALTTIYDHRSNELHAGIPFPGPLCEPPMTDEQDVATEKVHSMGIAGQGAVWTEADLPMHLHVFAHIAGGALRNWWRELSA
jgi:hypothetical protein